MSSATLININVDSLFEQHNIAEIDQVQKTLQVEVEKKREDLRTMVGERYRDLLKAADTIAGMKDTSTSLISQVEQITANCRSLNEKQLIGFKTEAPQTTKVPNQQLHTYFSTVIQIKLLTNLPELIWTQIDEEQFFVATQLFILSRHISTGLQLDVDNSFMKYFPVAKKHWTILNPFFFNIKQSCLSVLERDQLSPESATDCLLSLYLLEKTSFDNILSNFLQLRAKAFLASLSSEKSVQKRAKERILSSLEVLNSTILLIYKCFIDGGTGKGMILEKLQELSDTSTKPTISLMALDESDLVYKLPDIIANFKPSFEIPEVTPKMLSTVKSTWLETITKITENQLKSIFDLVTSMKTIQEIKHQSLQIKKFDNWSTMCEKLHLPSNLDFYQHSYRPLINNRVRDIIRQSWTKTVSATFDEVQSLVNNSKQNKKSSLYIWEESSNDIPGSLKQALHQDKKCNKLLMKAKGIQLEIVEICTSFDNRLKTIFSEVNVLLEEDGGQVDEKQSLVEFLKDTSQEQALDLISKVKSLEYDRKNENFVLLAHLFTSLTELCPNLKLCLSHSYSASTWERLSTDKKNYEKWNKVCALFDEESFALWKLFCEEFLKDFALDKTVSRSIGVETILNDFAVWESITIEAKDDQDNPVQSTIRVPSQPRISLQIYLFKLIQSLNKSIPETLPRKVLHYLNTKLVQDILSLYGTFLNNEFVSTNQNAALQLYFDLKFFQIILLSRDDKKVLEEFQKLTNGLKNYVDPFDFELFHSHLSVNVKKCANRMQHELGVMLPYPENLGMLADVKQSAGGQDKDPNVLCLSSNGSSSTWFPLLPIIVPGAKGLSAASSDTERPPTVKSKKTESKLPPTQPTAQNYASNVKSGAAAFFGAMSQDWFR